MKQKYMKIALDLARQAEQIDEVPVGCVVVLNDEIIATGYNTRETTQQVSHHAEMIAIEKACEKLKTWRLENCELYVTLEPCLMCAGALTQARIGTVVFGASDPKGGAYGSVMNVAELEGLNHYPKVIKGVLEEECSSLLKNYFKTKRNKNKHANHVIISSKE